MPRTRPGPPCSVCGEPSTSRNLCAMHHSRWLRHGHLEQTRPDDWGKRNSHLLNQTWRTTVRTKLGRVERWSDFWAFVADVGDRPEKDARLAKRDKNKPWGPNNFFWKESLGLSPEQKADKAFRQRAWRSANPTVSKGYYLKRSYGISVADYDAMLEAQEGKCAICKQECNVYGRLSVDHCHATKKVRALLCTHCNRGIGMFHDNPDLLMSAALYMEQHR